MFLQCNGCSVEQVREADQTRLPKQRNGVSQGGEHVAAALGISSNGQNGFVSERDRVSTLDSSAVCWKRERAKQTSRRRSRVCRMITPQLQPYHKKGSPDHRQCLPMLETAH